MQTTPMPIAIIGLGAVAEAHLAAYSSLSEVEIIAVVDPRRERTEAISKRLNVPGFPDCTQMLQQVRPKIGCVLSTVASHRPITEVLAAAGVHILCEKPMTTCLDDALAMAHACRRHNVEYMYGSSYRYLPTLVLARKLIAEGVIGRVLLLEEKVIDGSGRGDFVPMSEAHYPQGTPGGGGMGLVDHGIHLLDILPWLTDSRIMRVLGRGNYTGAPMRTEFALLELDNGAIASLFYQEDSVASELPWEGIFSMGRSWKDGHGFAGEVGEWTHNTGSIRIHGSRGALRIFHYANKMFLHGAEGPRELTVPAGAAPDHFGAQLCSFVTALRKSQPAPVGASVGIQAVQALTAIYESDRSKRWVEIEKLEY